jgi:hypothetical protein
LGSTLKKKLEFFLKNITPKPLVNFIDEFKKVPNEITKYDIA